MQPYASATLSLSHFSPTNQRQLKHETHDPPTHEENWDRDEAAYSYSSLQILIRLHVKIPDESCMTRMPADSLIRPT